MSASTSDGGEVIVYGASDDCLEFEGAIEDEFCEPFEPIVVELHGPDHTPDEPEGLLIVGVFTDAGTWAIGVAPLDECVNLPDWQPRLSTSRNALHSTELHLRIPAGTTWRGTNG